MKINKPIQDTYHNEAYIINTYSVDYIFDKIEKLIKEYPFIEDYLSYNPDEDIRKVLRIELDGINVSVRRTIFFYYLWTKCHISGVEWDTFVLTRPVKWNWYHLDLCVWNNFKEIFTIDHLIPASKWWSDDIDNLEIMLSYYNHVKWNDEDYEFKLKDNSILEKDINIIWKVFRELITQYNTLSKKYCIDNKIPFNSLKNIRTEIYDWMIVSTNKKNDELLIDESYELMDMAFIEASRMYNNYYFDKNGTPESLRRITYEILSDKIIITAWK